MSFRPTPHFVFIERTQQLYRHGGSIRLCHDERADLAVPISLSRFNRYSDRLYGAFGCIEFMELRANIAEQLRRLRFACADDPQPALTQLYRKVREVPVRACNDADVEASLQRHFEGVEWQEEVRRVLVIP